MFTIDIVPVVGKDTQSHLIGTHTFIRAQDYQSSGIRQAAFRVVLRQEIVFAFKTQSPIQLLTEYVQVDRYMDQIDDWTSAFHIIVLCAEVLSYCYGDDAKSANTWTQLTDRAQIWITSKPASFEPSYSMPRKMSQSQVFPQIWLLNECHGTSHFVREYNNPQCSFRPVAAHQHYLICRILLEAHNPRCPQLGPRRAEAIDSTNVCTLVTRFVFTEIFSVHYSRLCEGCMWHCLIKLSLYSGYVYS